MSELDQIVAAAPATVESLKGRPFDAYQNMMQIAACLREACRQLDLAEPRVLELSRYPTGLADYFPGPLKLQRYPTHNGEEPLLTTPVALPFADKSFDCCLVTDAYEHVPETMRPSLLAEMLRVTDGLVLLGCPQHNETVSRFDQIVFDFIWGKYAERFEPLEQHHTFGLDTKDEIEALLLQKGAHQVAALPCNYIYRWIHMILIYFDLQHKHPHGDLIDAVNRVYNEHMSAYDYREPCYRYLMAVATSPRLDATALMQRLQAPAETPAHVAATDRMLVDTLQQVDARAIDRLRDYTREMEIVRVELERLRAENTRLHAILSQVQSDNRWAIAEIELLRRQRVPGS